MGESHLMFLRKSSNMKWRTLCHLCNQKSHLNQIVLWRKRRQKVILMEVLKVQQITLLCVSDQSTQLNMEHLWSQKKLEKGKGNVQNQKDHKFEGTVKQNELDWLTVSC